MPCLIAIRFILIITLCHGLNSVSPKRFQFLISNTWERGLRWKEGLWRWSSSGEVTGAGPNLYAWALIKRRNLDTQKDLCRGKTMGDTGRMSSRSRGMPEATRSQERNETGSPSQRRKEPALPAPASSGFWPPEWEIGNFSYFKPPSLWSFYAVSL